MKRILEVCAGDIASVRAAAAGGAARVELCQALAEGGVTPSIGLIKQAMTVPGVKVNVLIRPREGDFCYSEDEIAVMEEDIRAAVEAGVNGIVIGCLNTDGTVSDANRRLIAAAKGCSVTFHRAFDLVSDPFKALEKIISMGCDRILTSGLAPSAVDGADTLAKLRDMARGRIIILAGGGVGSSNAATLVRLTGVNEVHASARKRQESRMNFRRTDVSMGAQGADEYSRLTTDTDEVRAIVEAINQDNIS